MYYVILVDFNGYCICFCRFSFISQHCQPFKTINFDEKLFLLIIIFFRIVIKQNNVEKGYTQRCREVSGFFAFLFWRCHRPFFKLLLKLCVFWLVPVILYMSLRVHDWSQKIHNYCQTLSLKTNRKYTDKRVYLIYHM